MNKVTNAKFLFKLVFIGCLMMFLSMAVGELVKPELFNGLLRKPTIWFWVFVESAIWLLPFSILGLFFINKIKDMTRKKFLVATAAIWFSMGSGIIIAYKLLYFPEDWKMQEHLGEVVFGWVMPCLLIWFFFTRFSMSHFQNKPV